MSTWDEDRKFVLEALKCNREEHKEILVELRRIRESQWGLKVKVAGIAGGAGLVVAGIAELVKLLAG